MLAAGAPDRLLSPCVPCTLAVATMSTVPGATQGTSLPLASRGFPVAPPHSSLFLLAIPFSRRKSRGPKAGAERQWDCRCQRTPAVMPLPPGLRLPIWRPSSGSFQWLGVGIGTDGHCGAVGKDQRHLTHSLWLSLTPGGPWGGRGKREGKKEETGKEGWEQRHTEKKGLERG